MTKAQIQALITAIGDGLANKALKIRTAYEAFMNEFYSEIQYNQYNSNLNTTVGNIVAVNSNFVNKIWYELRFSKKGNVVFVSGRIIVFNSVTNNGFPIIDIIDNNYKPITSQDSSLICNMFDQNTFADSIARIELNNDGFNMTNSAIASGNSLYINGFYFTND